MTAVLTDALKRIMLDNIYTNVSDSGASVGQFGPGNYYLGIAKSQDWDISDTPVDAKNTLREERNFRLNLQSMKQAESVSYVVPRNNWASSTVYSAYDDDQQGYPSDPYYVLTEDSRVFICLEQGKDATGTAVNSTVKPNVVTIDSGASPRAGTDSFKGADGYVWKFLYTINSADRTNYLSTNFMPVKKLYGDDPIKADWVNEDSAAFLISDSASPGNIGSITVLTGGSGFTTVPTVTISGISDASAITLGDSAAATAILSGGSVVDIQMDSNVTGRLGRRHGTGYTAAAVTISGGGGSGATARANLSPIRGFGHDPKLDLRSSGLMFNSKLTGDEEGKFLIGQDFRQVGLIKNPRINLFDSDLGNHFQGTRDAGGTVPVGFNPDGAGSVFAGASGLALNKMLFAATAATDILDTIIVGATSGAKAYVDRLEADSSNRDFVYWHQDEATGFKPFAASEAIVKDAGGGSVGSIDSAGCISTIIDINRHAGDILYIENMASVDRSASQTEDIKVIIQI